MVMMSLMRCAKKKSLVAASKIAVLPLVRKALVELQVSFDKPRVFVADGRDMGTCNLPDAIQKVFLTASVEARANRRYKQLIEKGFPANMEDLVKDLAERDARDMAPHRSASQTRTRRVLS